MLALTLYVDVLPRQHQYVTGFDNYLRAAGARLLKYLSTI